MSILTVSVFCKLADAAAEDLFRTLLAVEMDTLGTIKTCALKRTLQRRVFKSVIGMVTRTQKRLRDVDGIVAVATLDGRAFVASIGRVFVTTIYYNALGTVVLPTVRVVTGSKAHVVKGSILNRYPGAYCVFTTVADDTVLTDEAISAREDSAAMMFVCVE